jgi:hypothetical protein
MSGRAVTSIGDLRRSLVLDRKTEGGTAMRKVVVTRWLVAIAGLAILALAVAKVEAQTAPAPKVLRIVGTNNFNQRVDASMSIGVVSLQTHAGGPYSVAISAGVLSCTMRYASAEEAAAVQARIADPKTREVMCEGPVTTTGATLFPQSTITQPTDLNVLNGP